MKLQLINAPLPTYMSSCLRSHSYPPLNLLALATYVKKNLPDIEIENLDGETLGKNSVVEKVDADYIGISCNSLSYETAIEIAKEIKLKRPDCTIILGGSHATQLYNIIIRNHTYFDIIVRGKGEHALVGILQNKPLETITNCVFRKDDGSIIETEFKSISLRKLPFPDFSLISLQDYHTNFQKHYPDKEYKKGITAYSSSGCVWRIANNGGCVYCSTPDWNYSIVDPVFYWEHIQDVADKYGVDFVWDVSDTFTSPKKWLKEFAKTKPNNLNVGFHVYARLDDLDEKSILTLKQIGIKEMLVGIESYDDQILRNANKGLTNACIKQAIRLLNDYKIDVAVSFALGLPGESEKTLQRTLRELEEILWMSNILENHSSVLLPLPGSPIYNRILTKDPILGPKYCQTDMPDIQALQWDYLEKYTNCGAKIVFDYYLKIDSLFSSAGPFYLDKRSPIFKQLSYKEIIAI